jgi:hypothetical protein
LDFRRGPPLSLLAFFLAPAFEFERLEVGLFIEPWYLL